MRRLAAVLSVALLLAACGSDEELSEADAEKIVENAQLTVADLGDGWEKTADEPSDDDDSEDDQLEECLGEDAEINEDVLAESNERTFERSTSEIGTQQVLSSSAVPEDPEAIEQYFAVIDDDKFATCLSDAMEEEIGAEASGEEFTIEVSDPEIVTDEVDGADESAHVSIDMAIDVQGLEIPGRFDLVLAARDRTVLFLATTSFDEPVEPARITELIELLVERAEV